MKTEHTPGPWHYELQHDIDRESNGYRWAITVLTKEQRELSTPGFDYVQNPAYANSKANARLMAAAPELLAACQYVVKWHREHDSGEGELYGLDFVTTCIGAIAKAKGATP